MDLTALSRRYGDFYAPAYSIRIGADDLVRDLLVAVTQLEVDLQLGTPSHFSFTIANAYSLKDNDFWTGRNSSLLDLLSFGTSVDICMGYGDARTVPRIAKGIISELSTNFPETGSPELSVSGCDRLYMMTLGKNTRTWTQRLDSDVVHELASYHNLNSEVATTTEKHAQIEQNNESDYEFLKKLATRNHFEFYVDSEGALHFHKPRDESGAIVSLKWGEGLLSFKPEANLAGQVSKVEVRGWNPKTKETIVGRAMAGQETGRDARQKSAGDLLKQFIRDPSKQPVLRLRQPVFTQAEANSRAKAALNETAKKFLTGDAESIGLPEIRPDRKIELSKLGPLFSKSYYVQQATHKIDGNGYRTRFKVKESTQ